MAQLNIISDMDGVIYRGKEVIPGALDFVRRLITTKTRFLFLTNNSEQTPRELKQKLEGMNIVGLKEENFITSAMATAIFLAEQNPRGTAYVIGGAGLSTELHKRGLSFTENQPDYVVVGKTAGYNFDMMKKAVRLINQGAKFIGTNPDMLDPVEEGVEPAAGAILASIEAATGKKPYIVGKPNSLMMLIARKQLGVHSEETVMIGDRMNTDIVGGLEAGMKTCLVLSGVNKQADLQDFPYKPDYTFNNVGEIDLEGW